MAKQTSNKKVSKRNRQWLKDQQKYMDQCYEHLTIHIRQWADHHQLDFFDVADLLHRATHDWIVDMMVALDEEKAKLHPEIVIERKTNG